MEAAGLSTYRFFRRLGFFGVEPGTTRGSRNSCARAGAILERPRTAPVDHGPGPLRRPAAKAARRQAWGTWHTGCAGVLLPLALEYPFWEERIPEALARSAALFVEMGHRNRRRSGLGLMEQALDETQDDLARKRPPRPGRLQDPGRRQGGGRRSLRLVEAAQATARGETFAPEHQTCQAAGGDVPMMVCLAASLRSCRPPRALFRAT